MSYRDCIRGLRFGGITRIPSTSRMSLGRGRSRLEGPGERARFTFAMARIEDTCTYLFLSGLPNCTILVTPHRVKNILYLAHKIHQLPALDDNDPFRKKQLAVHFGFPFFRL